jgi:hypothetical protein
MIGCAMKNDITIVKTMTGFCGGTHQLTQNDLDALKLAIEYAKRDRKGQIESKLLEEAWIDVATFASYHCQMQTLRLDSADSPPCWIDDPDKILAEAKGDRPWHYGEREAAMLLRKMLSLGISQYHPDPVAAIEDAQKL